MAFSATPKFPGAVAAVGDLLNQANRLASSTQPTLSAAITSTATTATLATGTGAIMPSDNFTVTVDSEIMLITSRTGDTLTIGTRGYQGTTAVAHNAAANVDAFIIASHHNQLAAEVNAIESQLGASLANVVLASKLAAANGVATLDSSSRLTASQIPATSVQNNLSNTFSTGTKQTMAPSAAGGAGFRVQLGPAPTTPAEGDVYIDATSHVLQWFAGGTWQSGAGGSTVTSVFGRTGAVVAATGDYTAAQVTGAEATANKNAASGYAGLDASTKLLATQLPSVVVRTDISNTLAAGTKLIVAASAAGSVGLNIPLGVTPTTPVAGDVYIDSSSFVLKWYANGAWQSGGSGGSGAVTSVYGRTGAVVATTGDYTVSQITGAEATANKGAASGYASLDANSHLTESQVGIYAKNANLTAAAVSTSTTSAQTLMTYALAAGYMDVLTRALRVRIGGFYSTSGSACNMTLSLNLANVNGLGQIVFAVPASASDNAWDGEYIITRNSTGTSGVLTSVGRYSVQSASAPASAVVGHREWTNDMTVAQTLQTQVTFSVASSSNVCRQYYMIVERINY